MEREQYIQRLRETLASGEHKHSLLIGWDGMPIGEEAKLFLPRFELCSNDHGGYYFKIQLTMNPHMPPRECLYALNHYAEVVRRKENGKVCSSVSHLIILPGKQPFYGTEVKRSHGVETIAHYSYYFEGYSLIRVQKHLGQHPELLLGMERNMCIRRTQG